MEALFYKGNMTLQSEHAEIMCRLFNVEKYREYGTLEFADLFCRLFPASVYPEYRHVDQIEIEITKLLYNVE